MRAKLFSLFLWLAIIAAATWFGGTLYQMLVIVPMWAASPPESVREFFTQTRYNETIWNFFGPPFMIARSLPLVLAIIFGWHLRPQRTWLLIAVLVKAFGIAFTLFYIYPINEVLFLNAGGNHSPEEVRQLVDKWVLSDRIRFVVGTIGFISLLRALSLPIERQRRHSAP
ncbi:MAG TPA: DUF1772 domain-containing protein [Pyrinomonadaceae bacterium]